MKIKAILEKPTTIALRALEPDDINLLYNWENDSDNWHYSNTLSPFSKYTLKKYIENAHLDIIEAKQIRFVIETSNKQAIGFIDLFEYDPFHNRAAVGILIGDKSFRKKGYASAALTEIKIYAFNILHLNQLYCNVGIYNTDSLKLFKNNGFVISGTKKKWIFNGVDWEDELILQCFKDAQYQPKENHS